MTTTYHNLAGGDFAQNWSNTGLISLNDDWSGVPSIVGYKAEATSASVFDPRTFLTDTGLELDVIANQSATNNSGGVVEVDQSIANPSIAFQGSNSADLAAITLYLNATGRENVTVNANLRDLDASADASTQQVAVQYRVGETGNWTNIDFVADASGAGATLVTPVSVTLPAAADNQAQVQVRFVVGNASGNDELIGVDDILVSSDASGGGVPNPGALSIADASVLEGDTGQTAISFVVSRAGGDDGAVSADYTITLPGGASGADASDFVSPTLSGTVNFADGETSKSITLQVAGDTVTEPSETFTVALSNPTGGVTISDANAIGTITNDDIVVSKIHDIQGAAFFSPVLAAEGITAFNVASAAQVTVTGVVTAIDTFLGSGMQGFYISEEQADWDADSHTSEGIFVRTSGATAGLAVGETVTVTANVMEFQDFTNLNRTILVNPTAIVQGNDSVALPTFVIDGTLGHKIPTSIISDDNPVFTDSSNASGTFDPENDALDFYETVEGMRVTMTNMVVGDGFVGGSNDNFVFFNAYSADNADPSLINSRGGYTITGDPQLYPVDTPGTADDVNNGGRTMTDGATHGDIIELDFGNVGRGGTAAFDQHLTMGDELGDVSGIVDFDFGVAKLYVTDALDPTKVAALDDTTPVQEQTALFGDDRALRVATFNVENLSPVGTTFSTNNGVEITTQAKYDKLAAHIADNLKSPDIIVVEEVQDNNGVTQDSVTDASTTWQQLVNAVNTATGKTYQWVDEAPSISGDVGGAPGGNIRVGFLYDTGRVSLGDLDANATLAERREFTDRIGDGVRDAGDQIAIDDSQVTGINAADWAGTRRSIVGEFQFNGQTVYAFGSHLPSKGGSDDPFEIGQNNGAGVPANGDWGLRNTLAQDVWSMQNLANTADPDAKVVSAGDFNEFWFYRPLEVLTGYANPDGTPNTTGTDYVNLMVQELPTVERFSYDFDGRSEALDSILSDQALAGVASYDVVHINTGYNDRTGAVNPASSDHDPSLASFDFRDFDETLVGTTANDSVDGFAGIDTFVLRGARAGYTITNGGTTTITDINLSDGNDGTDTLTNVEFVKFADQTVATGGANVFTLQLLHFSDAESGLLAATTAPNLAALVDAFEDDYANSITIASGDLFLPGPFLAAGTDPSITPLVPGNSNPARVDISMMNAIGVQLSAIGNHEFDLGSNVFASAITPGGGYSGALFPYLSANLDFSGDSALNPRFTQTVGVNGLEDAATLNGRIAPSAVLTEGGEKIGFVGATTQVLEQISSPSGTEVKGFPTGAGPNGEINDMDLLAAQLQPVINDLISQGVNKIVIVSHLQQIELEQQLATKLQGVDIIISGGSNTRLGDSDDEAVSFPGHSNEFEGAYPIVTAGTDGKTTLIVNTDSEFTYLGRLVVDFDDNGDIVLDSVAANTPVSGAYAATNENVAEAWNTTVDNLGTTAFADGTRGDNVKTLTDAVQTVITVKDGNIFGYSNVYLEGERSQVRTQETNLGDISADANADAARDALGLSADVAVVSIKNGGGIRAQIGTIVNNPDGTVTKVPPEVGGEVSQLDAENALRFDNKLMVFDTTAQGLLNILNSPNALAPNNGGFIQIGGVRFSYDPTKAAGSRVQDIALINERDEITAVIADNGVVVAGAPSQITVSILNFTAQGGDGYLIKQNGENFRYMLNDGTVSAAVDEALDFTANTPANALGEIKAFQDYLQERYSTPGQAYDVADTPAQLDQRIQNQAIRADEALDGIYLRLGTAANNTITGDDHNEALRGLAGNDKLLGNGGDDILVGGLGKDTLNGGEGIDTVDYSEAAGAVRLALGSAGTVGEAMGDKFISIENFVGTDFDDYVTGSAVGNRMDGGDGADFLSGLNGNDELFGDGGNDVLTGGNGADLLNGGQGDDLLIGGVGLDALLGSFGDDVFEGRLVDIKGDTIEDFSEGDAIRVVGLNPTAVTVSWAAGVLSIDPDGAGRKAATTLQLDGVFDSANFHVANDGLGNTLITYSETVI